MTTAKEKLVKRLLEGNDDIFTQFIIVGLEENLEVILSEVKRLLEIESLSLSQTTDLNDLYQDGKATIRVLRYHTVSRSYMSETAVLNKAWDKLGETWF